MMAHRQARDVDGEHGFTLLELLVVLGIVALALALVAPSMGRTRTGLELRTTAHELAGHLRSVRAAAQRGNVEHVLSIDLAGRRYWAAGVVPSRSVPPPLSMELQLPDSERVGAAAGRVRFFPDGSASGGRILIRDARATAAIAVDWLNGDVRLQMRE
jgi:general secretion pathway protein H